MGSRKKRRGFPVTIARAALGIGAVLALALAALIVVYRFVPPVSTLMLARWAEQEGAERHFVPLARISENL
ncbi:MAG: monofunctional biosynthetic peptidoglycan transglycosylase, partial [Methylocapsa sp.]|nr:monofunctional biosynthetic peptidoglycan transglycosylase [Methylocapsa sp.]